MTWHYIGAAVLIVIGLLIVGTSDSSNNQMERMQDKDNAAWMCIVCFFIAACLIFA